MSRMRRLWRTFAPLICIFVGVVVTVISGAIVAPLGIVPSGPSNGPLAFANGLADTTPTPAPDDFSFVATTVPDAQAPPVTADVSYDLPTPTPRPGDAPPRVGLQVGHLRSNELPDELARLRTSTGTSYGGVTEAELNFDIAMRIKPLLEAYGVVVDILPATVPPSYDADVFVAIHADGARNTSRRGWKLSTAWRASDASKQLQAAIAQSYGPATGLPLDVNGITSNMRGYYAFSYNRFEHTIARTTPAIIFEMGFMTNAADRQVLFGQPDNVAQGIATGIVTYLQNRDRNNGAALLPPDFPAFRAIPSGAVLRTAPDDNAPALLQISPDQRVIVFDEQGEWFEGVVRGEWGTVGWVSKDQLEVTNEEPIRPTPANP